MKKKYLLPMVSIDTFRMMSVVCGTQAPGQPDAESGQGFGNGGKKPVPGRIVYV